MVKYFSRIYYKSINDEIKIDMVEFISVILICKILIKSFIWTEKSNPQLHVHKDLQ